MSMRRQFFSAVMLGLAGMWAMPALAQQEQPADQSQQDRPSAQNQQDAPQTQQSQPQRQGEQQPAPDPQQRDQQRPPQQSDQQQRIMLGVGFATADPQREGQELEIAGVMPGSTAERAGLQRGDRIISINGQEVSSVDQLDEIVQQHSVGDTAQLVILRNGQQREIQVTFAAPPRRQNDRFQSQRPAFDDGRRDARGWLGVTIDTEAPERGEGVRIGSVYPAGPAARAGLRTGDQILEVEGQRVSDFQQLLDALANTQPGDSVELVVASNGEKRTVNVNLEDASVFDTGRDPFDQLFSWRDPSGFSAQIADHDMMLEQHRRFAEQHQRLEELLLEVKQDLEQIKQQLNIQSAEGRTNTPQGRTTPGQGRGNAEQGRNTPPQNGANR